MAFWRSLYTLCVPSMPFLAVLIYYLFTYQKNKKKKHVKVPTCKRENIRLKLVVLKYTSFIL